jgi:hypothetical protein
MGVGGFDGAQRFGDLPPAVAAAMADLTAAMDSYGGNLAQMELEYGSTVAWVINENPSIAKQLAEALGLSDSKPESILMAMRDPKMGTMANISGGPDANPEMRDALRQLMAAVRDAPEASDGIRQMASASVRMIDAANQPVEEAAPEPVRESSAGPDTPGALALAIQTAGEAYVLGWSITPAGGSYLFGGAPTSAPAVARASEFDSVVNASTFTIDFSSLGQSDEISRVALPGAPEPEEEPEQEEEKPRETTRRTPRGPITIPGGG